MNDKEERIKEALEDLDWFGDFFYCTATKEESLKLSKAVIDIKKLLKELGELNEKK